MHEILSFSDIASYAKNEKTETDYKNGTLYEEESLKMNEKSMQMGERQTQMEERQAQMVERQAQMEERQTQLEEQYAQMEEQYAQLIKQLREIHNELIFTRQLEDDVDKLVIVGKQERNKTAFCIRQLSEKIKYLQKFQIYVVCIVGVYMFFETWKFILITN